MPENNLPVIGKYIDLLTDFGFKRVFGSEPNKDLLIDLLNSVLSGRKHIVDLIYNKNEHPGDTKDDGAAIFDLTCTGVNGERFIIEVQRGKQANFKQRAVFYTSQLAAGLAPKGKRIEWAYDLPEIYLIALLEDFSIEPDQKGRYAHHICLMNKDTGKVFYNGLNYIFLELVNFAKDEAELDSDLDRWLYVLGNISRMDMMPVFLRKPIFEKLFSIAEYSNLTKDDKEMYNRNIMRKWDEKNILDYAVSTAVSSAVKTATEEAERKLAQAEDERKKLIGEMEAGKRKIALSLQAKGMSYDEIAAIMGVTVEQITEMLK